jgi:hypothetical protein
MMYAHTSHKGSYVKYGLKYSEYNENILIMYLTKNQIFEIMERLGETK